MACSAGDQPQLASLSPPCLSPPPFLLCSFMESPMLTFLAVVTLPALCPSLCPSQCPSQEGASFPARQPAWGVGQHLVWQGLNHKLAEASPEAWPPGSFPPAPSAQPRGQRRLSKTHGSGPETPGTATQRWREGVCSCISDVNVWGTGRGSCSMY